MSARWHRMTQHRSAPYRLKSQTSTIAAKHYAPPLVDAVSLTVSAQFDSGQALYMQLSTYCQMDLPRLTGMYAPWSVLAEQAIESVLPQPLLL